jgi:mRNA interferase MazF
MVNWVPSRRDIIWIDCSPQAGKEMRNLHPFLVLSPKAFNDKTSLVLGLPMTTASYNKTNPFAVDIGKVKKQGKSHNAYVLCHQVKSFDWRARDASKHPMAQLEKSKFVQACAILNQIIDIQ